MTNYKNKKKHLVLNVLKKTIIGLFIFFIALILFIRSPWGQDIIVNKATSYLSNKTNTKVSIKKLFVTFSGNIVLEGLYLEDKKEDTLVYSKNLEASIAFAPLLRGKKVHLKSLDWNGLTLNVKRKEKETGYNYDFLIDALSASDTTNTATNKTTPLIQVGTIRLTDFKISYDDKVSGIDSRVVLGSFEVELQNVIDLKKMHFHIKNIALSDSKISYTQSKAFAKETETIEQDSLLSSLQLDKFKIENVNVLFSSIPDDIFADIQVGDFLMEVPKVNLTDQQIEINELALNNSNIYIKSIADKNIAVDSVTIKKTTSFEWPNWNIKSKRFSLQNNTVKLQTGSKKSTPAVFNPEFVVLNDLNILADQMYLTPNQTGINLETISFKERSGFMLKNFTVDLVGNKKSLTLTKLHFETNANELRGKSDIYFNSINQVINQPELTKIDVSFSDLRINPKDAYFLEPSLRQNKYIKTLQQKDILGKLTLDGSLQNIHIQNTSLRWGAKTSILVSGTIANSTVPDQLHIDLKGIDFKTNRTAISQFVTEKELGISIPEFVKLNGTLKGGYSSITPNLTLQIPEGVITLDGTFRDNKFIDINGKLDVQQLNLGQLLKNESLGIYTFNTKVSAKGSSINTLDGTITSKFSKLEFNSYDYSGLNITGKIVDSKGNLDIDFKDNNLDFLLNTEVKLDTVSSEFSSVFKLKGADLKALGLTREAIKTKFEAKTEFTGNTTNFDLSTRISNGLVIYDNRTYPFEDLLFSTNIQENSTNAKIQGQSINSELASNTNPTALLQALGDKLKGYFKEEVVSDTTAATSAIQMEMDLSLHPSPMIKEVFLQGIEELDTIHMVIDFDENKDHLLASLNAPRIQYNKSNLDSLKFYIQAEKENLKFNFGFKKLASDPILIKDTYLEGKVVDKKLLVSFNAFDEQEQLAHLESEITMSNDTIVYHLKPSELILNRKQWEIPINNKTLITQNSIKFSEFSLSRNQQLIALQSSIPNQQEEHVGVVFENFKLATFTSILNPDETLANGLMKGDLILNSPFNNPGLIADLTIKSLEAMEVPFGELTLKAETKDASNYSLDLDLKGANATLDIKAAYTATNGGIDADILLNDFKIKSIERFFKDYISETSGSISGKMKLSGTTSKPSYSGKINFNKTALSINTLNTKFTLPEESIAFDNSGVFLDNFILLDKNKNSFVLDGKVTTQDLNNPKFDLSFKAKEILVINSTKEDNDLFYGKVNLNADMRISGDLRVPIIKGKLNVNESSDFTYVIPESELDVIEREGVLLFVNKKIQNPILTKEDDGESSSSTLKGFDIDAMLSIHKNATVRIIVDEQTGDNLQVSGTGDFNATLEPNGRTTLSGRYQVQQGHYEVSLYNLVKRKFKIAKGGTIVWRGDPLDAEMDIRAIYEVETTASGLMAARTSGEPTEITNKFRQKMPFLVYLNLEGELLTPKISFNLDIPENKRGELGGAVYNQVQKLNSREEELNKQVFSLLVLNQFFPSPTSDGSNGGSISLARDNANRVLANQLNNFSNKIIGNKGFELDFDIDSYTDYQGSSPQNKTQLDINARKKLFNDRLIVQVGSGVNINESSQNSRENTPVVGNVSLEYTLTKNGKYRLKGFRKNEFESVIDGQVIITGIGFIFNKEFNKFRELWMKERRIEDDKNKKKDDKE